MSRELDPAIWHDFADLGIGSARLETLHLERLRSLLRYVHDGSAYYRDKFAAAGVDPTNLTSLEEFATYPTFDKYEERESQSRSLEELGHPLGMHLTCDVRSVNRMSASSGTTGTPSFQGHTKADRDRMNVNFARLMDVIDSRPGDRVMMAGVMSMWVAGIPTVDALLHYGSNLIPIGGLVGTQKVAEMIELTKPDAIICTPSFARQLIARSRDEYGIDLTAHGVRQVCVYGEPGGSVPEVIAELSDGFGGAGVFDMSGGTGCLNPIFTSCEAQAGLHFIAPESAYIELYDRSTGTVLPWEDGAVGEFVYTGLDRECGPLIRFMDGDLMRVTLEPCACGLPGMRIHFIGRVDDMLLVKGVNLFPSAVQDLVIGFQPDVTGNIRIVKPTESPVIEPPLRVKVELSATAASIDADGLAARIADEIRRRLRVTPSVELFDEGTLPVEYGATGKYKVFETP